MKNKTWIWILGGLLVFLLLLSGVMLIPGEAAARAQIYSDGKLLKTVELSYDQEFTVETERGCNVVTVSDGKIGITHADCPDQHCVHRGLCDRGLQIVCLPNRLVIRFVGETELDGVTG